MLRCVFPLIIVLVASLNGALTQCPSSQIVAPCRCEVSNTEPVTISCNGAPSLESALGAIDAARTMQIDRLSLRDVPIERLKANAFRGFTIIGLVLNKNGLTDIDAQAFEGNLLDSLVELDLKENDLGRVPLAGVSRLRNLQRLSLSKNKISAISSGIFSQYASRTMLSKLDLSGNKLTDSGIGAAALFTPLRNLQELSLEANGLTAIPTNALVAQKFSLRNLNLGLNNLGDVPPRALDFPNLESLSLEYDGIESLEAETFRRVPKLLYLYLTGNKFNQWLPEMFRHVGKLRVLGIGETPIETIPSNAFQYTPNLIRLEMSEAAVSNIDEGAFQRVPNIQAIIMNKNRLSSIRWDMFRGLTRLYTLDLQNNKLSNVADFAWGSLPALRHLDVSRNQLQTLPENTFSQTFLPTTDARVLYICENPWSCDERVERFRQWLIDNGDIIVDKPDCLAYCDAPAYKAGDPFRQLPDREPPLSTVAPPLLTQPPVAAAGTRLPTFGWIILAIILAILTVTVGLLMVARFFISKRRRKQKEDDAEEEARIVQSAASGPGSLVNGGGYGYPASAVDLDLPPATSLDDRYWAY